MRTAAAQRLLLLGDPQQLPQVSRGRHPEPVDRSALGWLLGDAETIPDELGYFLAQTWRMHPALTAPVSRLAYDGRLRSREEVTTGRDLAGHLDAKAVLSGDPARKALAADLDLRGGGARPLPPS